ncbi:hypothetical protein Pmani_024055 [Petrolisthes manimaculis]|uniref:Uncharacterized protein n=1 Tax=Petrolisthes manimaculis TaxID=1843537 RepID=A0AAE1PAU5_9EUCA|nr:hypothetical protein Pmani_024055 [Petrolisthes manimaculis]
MSGKEMEARVGPMHQPQLSLPPPEEASPSIKVSLFISSITIPWLHGCRASVLGRPKSIIRGRGTAASPIKMTCEVKITADCTLTGRQVMSMNPQTNTEK